MSDKDMRAGNTCAPCPTLGVQTGPQTIIVRQIIGEVEKQKVLDIHVVVPDQKPAIEQIVDVFVKNVEVTNVEVITDKVIVRGEFELKAIYVACLPEQPVHAVELKHRKFTQDIQIPGARRGMDADASVVVEFVDYEIGENSRAYKHKYGHHQPCDDDHGPHCPPDNDDDNAEEECTREFDVSIVLKITGKVMADREVVIGAGTLPTTPKG